MPVINGEVMPKILRERLPTFITSILPKDGGDDRGADLIHIGYSRLNNDRRILSGLRSYGVNDEMFAALGETIHWEHASTRWGGSTSVETPHNSIHVIMGWPMATVEFAAFHPIFFLHHCNVDRIYEGYLKVDSDAQAEFEAEQLALQTQQGEPNRYGTIIIIHRYARTHGHTFTVILRLWNRSSTRRQAKPSSARTPLTPKT